MFVITFIQCIYNYILEINHVSMVHTFAVLLLTYLLTPWRSVLEKLAGFQLKKFPAFYESRRFITVFASAHHLYPS